MSTTESFKLPLADVVAHLRQAFPGDGVIHVGVGAGVGEMHTWRSWGIANALLIDANAQRSAWMDSEVAANPGWHCVHAVIRDSDGESPYYEASNPAESGLLDPALLTPIWPVLKRLESKTVPAVCLDSLIRQQGITWSSQWLIVDCMPAADIIQGAAPVLEHCSFVWVRAILDDGMSPLTGASLTNITALLEPYGFHLRAVQAGINPAVGEALFIRDWQTALSLRLTELQCQFRELTQTRDQLANQCTALATETAALVTARDEQAKLAADRLTEIETLQRENTTLAAAKTDLERRLSILENEKAEIAKALDEQTRLAGERQAQIQTLQKEKTELAAVKTETDKRLTNLETEKAELSKAREEQAKQVSDLRAEIDALRKADAATTSAKADIEQRMNAEKTALAKARDEQAKLASERLAQNEALQNEKNALSNAKLELEKRLGALEAEKTALAKAKDEQSKLAADRKGQIDQMEKSLAERSSHIRELESQASESARRQQMLHEEMLRAEAQIDLIKDVLLREPGI